MGSKKPTLVFLNSVLARGMEFGLVRSWTSFCRPSRLDLNLSDATNEKRKIMMTRVMRSGYFCVVDGGGEGGVRETRTMNRELHCFFFFFFSGLFLSR